MSADPGRRQRTALVTGVTGQDGILLARLLRSEGLRVVGTHRHGSPAALSMAPYLRGVDLIGLDVRDMEGFAAVVDEVAPDEIYNLAAMSSVGLSWQHPDEALEVNGAAPEAMLRVLRTRPGTRFLQAASAEESLGAADSPYARGKSRARAAAVLHIHESPLRRPTFVMRKITRAAAAIQVGDQDRLQLGTLDVRRDWGAAEDHVRAMRMIMAADEPGDFEVATGVVTGLREVVQLAFAAAGVDDPWHLVDVDESLVRPQDSAELVGDPEPIRRQLGWTARRTLVDTVSAMVAADRARLISGVEEDERYLETMPPEGASPLGSGLA